MFLLLSEKFDQKLNFIPDWPKLGHIRGDRAQTGRKRGSEEPGLILHSFYAQILSFNLISSFKWDD